jgi:hypothetical protein
MRKNALNALVALVFAVLVWAAIGARLIASDRFPNVPFELEVPQNVSVTYIDPAAPPGQHPQVEISIRAPQELFSTLAKLELRGRKSFEPSPAMLDGGEQLVEIDPSTFRIGMKGVEVTKVTPEKLKVSFSAIQTKSLPVKARLVNEPTPGPGGYRIVGKARLDPAVVAVTGPSHLLNKYTELVTEPIDLGGQTETYRGETRVDESKIPGLKPRTDRLRVEIVIEPEPEEDELELPLQILTTADEFNKKYEVHKTKQDWVAKVRLRGSRDALQRLRTLLKSEEPERRPVAFIEFRTTPETGKTDKLIEVRHLPPDVTYVEPKVPFELEVREKP